jgi:hypothetical protein
MNLLRVEERLTPLDGIAAVVLWVIGFIVLSGPADQPDTDAGALRALQYFKEEDGSILAGTFLFMLGALFFLWFLGVVRTRLYVAEGGARRVTGIAFAAGVATGISLLLMGGTQAAGAINNDHLTPSAAQVYLGIGDAFFYAAELAAALFLLAVGLLTVATGAFPRWLGWVSFVVAVWLLIPPIGWAALIFAFPIWLIVVSVILFSSREAEPVAAP